MRRTVIRSAAGRGPSRVFSAAEILAILQQRVHQPVTLRDLMQAMEVPAPARPDFRRQVRQLVAEGRLVRLRGGRIGLPAKMDLVVGRLRAYASGGAVVVPDETAPDTLRVHIAAADVQGALHGDRVVARVERQTAERAEGRIVRVLEHAQSSVVGRFEVDGTGVTFVVPFDRRMTADVHVPERDGGSARPGDMVTVELTQWPTPTRGPQGRVVEVIGRPDEPGVDVTVVLRAHGIPDAHDPAVVREARRAARLRDDRAGRTDFRSTVTVTIDGEQARDFDDAVSLERRPDGTLRLGVHIADVAHYVGEGTLLDRSAYDRGTSVYFPERAVHMFPEELATDVCSLRPEEDRLVQSCLMDIDATGQVRRAEFHDGVIRTAARMTYAQVNAILTDGDPETRARYAPLVPLFELMAELAEILRRRRRRRGSLDFDIGEARVVLDDLGRVEKIIQSERNVAHRLIEEFMLVANETVAEYLSRSPLALYRIHEAPDPLKVDEFEDFVSTLGHSLGVPAETARPKDFQRLLDRIRDTPVEKPIAFLMLRTMQKARYAVENAGHFGLAAECYTHFTSPIRRYPDLVVHRLLRAARHGDLDDGREEALAGALPETARHCSEMERRAEEAERELVQWKKVRFMVEKVGDEFTGFVTGVASFGLFVELTEHYVEGLVHVSSLADDYYRFMDQTHAFRGEHTGKEYALGDQVHVQVIRVDVERRQIDLGIVDVLEAVRARRSETGRDQGRRKAKTRRSGRRGRPGRRERAAGRGNARKR